MNGLGMSIVSHWVAVIVTPVLMKRLLSIALFLRSYLIQQSFMESLYSAVLDIAFESGTEPKCETYKLSGELVRRASDWA